MARSCAFLLAPDIALRPLFWDGSLQSARAGGSRIIGFLQQADESSCQGGTSHRKIRKERDFRMRPAFRANCRSFALLAMTIPGIDER